MVVDAYETSEHLVPSLLHSLLNQSFCLSTAKVSRTSDCLHPSYAESVAAAECAATARASSRRCKAARGLAPGRRGRPRAKPPPSPPPPITRPHVARPRQVVGVPRPATRIAIGAAAVGATHQPKRSTLARKRQVCCDSARLRNACMCEVTAVSLAGSTKLLLLLLLLRLFLRSVGGLGGTLLRAVRTRWMPMRHPPFQ